MERRPQTLLIKLVFGSNDLENDATVSESDLVLT
jgi:hypothetical protein